MAFSPKKEKNEIHWWELVSDYPELGEGLDAFREDPDADVVAAVGIFTMLKIRFLHFLPNSASDNSEQRHLSDDAPPPQAGGGE